MSDNWARCPIVQEAPAQLATLRKVPQAVAQTCVPPVVKQPVGLFPRCHYLTFHDGPNGNPIEFDGIRQGERMKGEC